MMIVTIVYINVKPEHLDEFIRATSENHFQSVKEPGNIRFDVLQKGDNPTEFALYEAYENESAVAAHKETAHYLKWRDKAVAWMANPRQGVRYNALFP